MNYHLKSPFRRAHLVAFAIIFMLIVLATLIVPTILDSNKRAHERVLSDLREIETATGQLPMVSR